jgi:probable phosphoglycerate mutase
LPRATETAHLIGDLLQTVPLQVSEAAGDYVPDVPKRDDLPADSADHLLRFLAHVTPEEAEHGATQAREAVKQFTGPVPGDAPRHELVITHNFPIGWLVTQALDAPKWRWLSLNHCNAGLTVIRYAPGRPSSVLIYNDMSHLPTNLRWTGFPPELQL